MIPPTKTKRIRPKARPGDRRLAAPDRVAAMWADYQRVRSLSHVARLHGRTRQAVWEIFRTRGYIMDGPRAKWPARRTRPQTSIQADGSAAEMPRPFTFADVLRQSTGKGGKWAATIFGVAVTVKPKRSGHGVLWNGQAWYWSDRGHYRLGAGARAGQRDRKMLHVAIWEQSCGMELPRGMVIWHVDRDYHHFRIANLEPLEKGDATSRALRLGEIPQMTSEVRRTIWAHRKTRVARAGVAALLANFEQNQTEPINVNITEKPTKKAKQQHDRPTNPDQNPTLLDFLARRKTRANNGKRYGL